MFVLGLAVLISLKPVRLECEFMVDPVGIDIAHPRLCWQLPSGNSGQKSYEIRVASKVGELSSPDLWDTGWRDSSTAFGVPYEGKALPTGATAFWSVRFREIGGATSKWSAPARWTQGINPQDWSAEWVAAPNEIKSPTQLLRHVFEVGSRPLKALCFICGLGQYQLSLNGQKVGDKWLTPSWTQYQKTCLYDTYDVTPMLRTGTNCIGVQLGNGMYDMSGDTRGSQQPNKVGDKKLLCQLEVWYPDGSVKKFGSNEEWKTHAGPETYSGVFGGEDWDNRSFDPRWDTLQAQNEGWQSAVQTSPPAGALHGITRAAPALMELAAQKPVSSHTLSSGAIVYDLGQNAPYVPDIVVNGEKGDSVTMWPSEALYPNGDLDQRTMREGKKCAYTLSGGKNETWHPIFWYCGSQYWKITAADPYGKPIPVDSVLKSFRGLLVHATEAESGQFTCSNETLNRIYNMAHWSMCGNFSNVVSDCPHREKSGWLEQLNMMGPDLMYCYDMRKMFDKAIHDMVDAQHADGRVPTMAPEYFFYDDGYADSVEWGGSLILVAEQMRTWYGDEAPIREQYPAMVRYIDYLGNRAKNDILSYGLGDWVGYGADPNTPPALTGTAYYFKLVSTMTGFADILGRREDAAKYRHLAERIRQHFNDTFYDPNTGKYGKGSQSSQSTALDFGLAEPGERQKVFNVLVDAIVGNHYGVSLGEAGHGPMLRMLTAFGRNDLVSKIHLQSKLPGYVYMINKGMTTLAETWDAGPDSWNHFMLGQIAEWYYGTLLGIRPDPAQPGFKHFFVGPMPVSEVSSASGYYDSVCGRISVAWKTDGKRMSFSVTVPTGTNATVKLPDGKAFEVGPGNHQYKT